MENLYDIPNNNEEQILCYKTVGERKIHLTFLPPLVKKYEKAPVYFIIPGGGWHMTSKESMIEFGKVSVNILRNEGFAVVSIDYRVYKEKNVYMKDIISDCFDALRYIAYFSEVLEINKNDIVLSGHSAGGHLALMLAYAPQNEFTEASVIKAEFKITGVAALSPISVLYKNDMPKTLGFDPSGAYEEEDSEEERKRTSPFTYVSEKCPRTLLCAGTSDYLVYPNSSELLYDKLLENNVEARLELSVGGGHVFEQMHKSFDRSKTLEDIQKITAEFLLETKR